MDKKLFFYIILIMMLLQCTYTIQVKHTFRQSRDINMDDEPPKIWSHWGKWSTCSVTCGAGTLNRWRDCIAGGCGAGEKQAQMKICTLPACVSDGQRPKIWDQWSKWACCSGNCQTARTIRWRHCVSGGCASGEKEAQIRECQLESCRNNNDN